MNGIVSFEGKYYRLQQTDFDGKSRWLETFYVSCSEDEYNFDISPNPFKDIVKISFQEATLEEYRMKVCNMLGEIVSSEKLPIGTYQLEISDLQNLKTGTYTLSYTTKIDV